MGAEVVTPAEMETMSSRLPDLLKLMHDMGIHWLDSDNALRQVWGKHLLEDWRSLELMREPT